VWWVGSKVGDLYLGTRSVQLRVGAELVLDEAVADVEAGLLRLAAALEGQPKRSRFRVWLGSGLCRPFLLPEVTGMGEKDDWMPVAESLAAEATGLAGPCRVWLDGARMRPRLAVAVATALISQVFEVLPEKRIQSLRPWWSEVLKVHAKREKAGNALAVSDSDGLTLLLADAQRFVHAQSYAVAQVDEQALLDRVLLTANWPTETVPIIRLGVTEVERLVFAAESQA
jgi:hypothetical protein